MARVGEVVEHMSVDAAWLAIFMLLFPNDLKAIGIRFDVALGRVSEESCCAVLANMALQA